ncbi:MAG: hypothetical protein HQ559_10890, partial [Lentisphaerae bacterium]|nr:hypothetical protein [Lentisphaerota bacterium]
CTVCLLSALKNGLSAEPDGYTKMFSTRAGISHFWFNPGLPRDLVNHDTHRDDAPFLEGYTGSTPLRWAAITSLDLILEASYPFTSSGRDLVFAEYCAKIPIQAQGREERQQANDDRPPEIGSFIYTQINGARPAHEAGIGLAFNSVRQEDRAATDFYWEWRPSVRLGYWAMEFEKGWNRHAKDEMATRSSAKGVSLSPRLDVAVGANTDTHVAFVASLGVAYRIINMEYEAVNLDEGTATGWELDGTVGIRF